MLDRAAHDLSAKLADSLKVIVPNSTVITVANIVAPSQLLTYLSIASVLLTMAYTAWRWRRDSKKDL